MLSEAWAISIPALPVDSNAFCAIALIVLVLFFWGIARLVTTATEDVDPAEIDREMLLAITELKSRGELSTEEYRSIKSQLVNRLADDVTHSDDDASLSRQDGTSEETGVENGSSAETKEGNTTDDEAASDRGAAPTDSPHDPGKPAE